MAGKFAMAGFPSNATIIIARQVQEEFVARGYQFLKVGQEMGQE